MILRSIATPSTRRAGLGDRPDGEGTRSQSGIQPHHLAFDGAVPNQGRFAVPMIQERVEVEPDRFHRMDLGYGIITPGRSDPATKKLPHFGPPDDMTGMRVLDVAAAEGFFSFESERRGATAVVAVDVDVDVDARILKRFAVSADALGSEIRPLQRSAIEIDVDALGTCDLVTG